MRHSGVARWVGDDPTNPNFNYFYFFVAGGGRVSKDLGKIL